jgi:hypothetical protein
MRYVHEFISFRFKAGIDRAAQFAVMSDLEPVMLAQPGLERREYFYSERDGSWVTHLVWRDDASIDAAGPRLEADPRAMELFEGLDLDSMHYSRFELVGEAGAAS